ncbi:MAG: hypothetical protein ABI229_11900 [Gemmatimonadaceae bacterium]
MARPIPAFIGLVVIVGLRLAAILWGLQLPVFQLDSPPGKH